MIVGLVDSIGLSITTYGTGGSGMTAGIDYVAFTDTLSPIFKTFAYSLCILLVGINIMESAVQSELFTLRGGVKVGAQLLLAKIWIDLSVEICKFIVNIACELTTSVIGVATGGSLTGMPEVNFGEMIPSSGVPIIGELIDIIMGILLLLPLLLMSIVALVLMYAVMFKLLMRTFEIAMLMTVSPVFFACLAGDATKQYFQKFISTFLGVVMQIVFMALVYAATVFFFRDSMSITPGMTLEEAMAMMMNQESWLFVMIAMGIMMVKPPKILTSLIS